MKIKVKNQQGASILELIVVFGLVSIVMGTAVSNLKIADDPLLNATNQVTSHMKSIRAKAVSTTTAYFIESLTPSIIQARVANNCDEAPEGAIDSQMTLQLPKGASMAFPNGELEVCYSARGLASDAFTFLIVADDGRVREIEVLLGGSLRVQ